MVCLAAALCVRNSDRTSESLTCALLAGIGTAVQMTVRMLGNEEVSATWDAASFHQEVLRRTELGLNSAQFRNVSLGEQLEESWTQGSVLTGWLQDDVRVLRPGT